jgi:PRC-barrel domain
VDHNERNPRFTKLEEQFKGYEVHDPQGEKIGTADDLFVNENDQPEYIGVKTGLLGMLGIRSTLLPIEVCTVDEERRVIEISESKDHIKDAPSFDGEDITPEYENTVRSHFGLEGSQISTERGSYGPHYPSEIPAWAREGSTESTLVWLTSLRTTRRQQQNRGLMR